MYKTVSSRLTAFWNVDGSHLTRYLGRKSIIIKSLCEDLILHDQIYVPTQDYLTACGLILIVGEKGFIELLERERLKFIRTRGGMGFISGKGPSELGIFSTPTNKHPSDSPIEYSVNAGLNVIEDKIKEKKKLHKLIVQSTLPIESAIILKEIKRESVKDLKLTSLWRPEYESDNPDCIVLPKSNKINVQVMGANNPDSNIGSALLSLALYNSDLYLAEKYGCQNNSPFFNICDLLDIKEKRLLSSTDSSNKLWSLLEVNNVPDFSQIDLSQNNAFCDFLSVVVNKNADSFRSWFHSNKQLSEKEILREYIGVLNKVPWIQSLPLKILRFIVTSGAGIIPGLGLPLSVFDTFVVDRIFRDKSPKFFIDDLITIKHDTISKK